MTITELKTSKTINTILWIVQVFLAVTFIWAGTMKLFRPTELPWLWVKENPQLVMFSAIFDLLAGFGLILPSLLRIRPKLTIYAAYGTIILMISASIFHIVRGEGSQIGFNIFLLVSAVFIAWGRLKKGPIKSKK
jgi:drug/metabolite transporter superfamily protein YnfA